MAPHPSGAASSREKGVNTVTEDGPTLPAAKPMPALGPKPRHAALRLIYAGTALLILLVLATNAIVIARLRANELLHQEEQLKSLSLILAEQADRSFDAVNLVLSSVAERIAAEGVTDSASFDQKMASHDIYLVLREKITGVPQLDAVNLIDGDGTLINSSRAWPHPDVNIADRLFFMAVKADPNLTTYVSEPVQNRATGTSTIYLVRRVNGANGQFLGLILGAIELRYFQDFYQAIIPSAGSSMGILRFDGVLLARFPQTDTIGKTFSNSQHLLQGNVAGIGREPSPIDGKQRIKAMHRLASYPVVALATETEEAALASWRSTALLMSLGALGCAVAIGFAGIAFGRQSRQQAALAESQAELRHQEDQAAAFEAMRAAKEAAELADRAKSEFLANMSHELRTPLNAVLGFSELMVGEAFGPLGNDRYRSYAQDIHSSGSHLLGIINDILDLSKAAAGQLKLVEDWISAHNVVASVCRLIQPRIDEGKLSLSVDILPGTLILCVDERLLKQMLLNLLSNACKFTPPGGHICCSVSCDATGVAFAVTDTGVGIPAEHLERVLEPFIQVDSSLIRRHEGTGLGLPLVKAMAELHGGTLRLASELGSGTTATLILPLNRVESASCDLVPEDATSAVTVEPVIT